MALKKLSKNIQSLFCSSINLFSYKRAVEELIYNALDAESTSIAIRINIQDKKIQVIDNGNGIKKEDFNLLGQRHTTSKFVDMSTLKSAPNSYGFRGQALASTIDVSKCVKITSRTNDVEETWCKTFYKGKVKELSEKTSRPSKGTTVEINEFLYNLKIQSKSVDHVRELNDIKSLLEHLSLVHNNISFSLRDDSRNEIIFQIHKNRDIYQTLKCLHNIDKCDVQELQVEKGDYKAKAYIAKNYDQHNRHHLLFLNKKVIHGTKLHKLAQDGLKKTYLTTKPQTKLKSKNMDQANEYDVFKNHNNIPFYFIFITCPYNDYEISNTPKRSTVEFKNWNQINMLIEKVLKFYSGDLKIYEIKRNEVKEVSNHENDETRKKVRQIMQKILGSYSKKPGVSQMHNGVKGKLIKRKKKTAKQIPISKVLPPKQSSEDCSKQIYHHNVENIVIADHLKKNKHSKTKTITPITQSKSAKNHHIYANHQSKLNMKRKINLNGIIMKQHQHQEFLKHNDLKMKKKKVVRDALINAFEKPTESLVKRCDLLAKEVYNNLNVLKKSKRKQRIFVNETINYSNIIKNNENFSIRNRVQETIIHDYIPLKPNERSRKNEHVAKVNDFKTSHDLVTTVLGFEGIPICSTNDKIPRQDFNTEQNCLMQSNLLTYQSHQYYNTTSHYNNLNKRLKHNENTMTEPRFYDSKFKGDSIIKYFSDTQIKPIRSPISLNRKEDHFNIKKQGSRNIKKLSKKATLCFPDLSENFTSHSIDFTRSNNYMPLENNLHNVRNNEKEFHDFTSIFENFTSHTIDLSENKICEPSETINNVTMMYDDRTFEVGNIDEYGSIPDTIKTNIELTYILGKSNTNLKKPNRINKSPKYSTQQPIIRHCETKDIRTSKLENHEEPLNVIFVSNSKASTDIDNINQHVDPLNVCEAILEYDDFNETEFQPKNITNMFNNSFLNFTPSEYFDTKNHEGIANLPRQIMTPENEISTLENEINHLIGQEMDEMEAFFQETMNDKNTQKIDANITLISKKEQVNTEQSLMAEVENFNINNRLRFLPKGMSQIFKTSHSKNTNVVGYNEDYFEEDLYNRFMDNIQLQTEIYEPQLQNPNDVTTRAIDKINCKLNQESSSLTFNCQSLTEANVLGQLDSKFIATIMKGKTESSDFLVLFDQHAVHERIRLEENLSDYFNGNTWKSVKVDDVLLKLSKEEIMYLHNYKDKFTPFGLHWTLLNNQELTLHAIPEAILGKNPRQVEKVINAVKNLITEQVIIIRAQKGCAYSYPKSIMDLVFSEACRYAIMFGDRLSKNECLELIRALSTCKTPFQCAHGRPVMAVIMEIKIKPRNYSIHLEKLRNFCNERKDRRILFA